MISSVNSEHLVEDEDEEENEKRITRMRMKSHLALPPRSPVILLPSLITCKTRRQYGGDTSVHK